MAVIPHKVNRRVRQAYDRDQSTQRNLIERAFQWHRIATRYDRGAIHFLAALQLVAAIAWST